MTSDEQPDTEVSPPAEPRADAAGAAVPTTTFREPPAQSAQPADKATKPKRPVSMDKPEAGKATAAKARAAKARAAKARAAKAKSVTTKAATTKAATTKSATTKSATTKSATTKSATSLKSGAAKAGAAEAGAGKAGAAKASKVDREAKSGRAGKGIDLPPPAASSRSESSKPAVRVLTIVAVVLLAATIALGILFVNERGTASDRAEATRQAAAARKQVLTTAQKTAIDFSSYDYRRLDQNFAQVASQLTGSFKKDYLATSASLKATLMQYQGVATAKVIDAGVSSISKTKAVVIVFLDQTVTSKVSKTPTVDRNRVRVALTRSGDRWLVSALDLK